MPSASLEVIKRRAQLLKQIRDFMQQRDILEVDTPILSKSANTDPNLHSFSTCFQSDSKQQTLYLNTSPEFAMKRLLAAGSGSIYQVCKVFRNEESGRVHEPEFTMLEWYRLDFDHHALMDEIQALLKELGLAESQRFTYVEVFYKYTGLNPHTDTIQVLQEKSRSLGWDTAGSERAELLEFLFSHAVIPELGKEGPCFIYEYPACQAALAKITQTDYKIAERFELFLNGMEIANGFNELQDYNEQRIRFEQENQRRKALGLDECPVDNELLAALEHGLPQCAGVALGLDRLLMVLLDCQSIDEVITFPIKQT